MNLKKQKNSRLSFCLFFTLMISLVAWTNTVHANCPTPDNIQVSIQGTTALLTWDPVPNAISYQVGYYNQNDGSNATASTTGTSYIFTNLTPGVYQFWVSARCFCEDEGNIDSAPGIIVEEIDVAMEELYNCLCDYHRATNFDESGEGVRINFDTETYPCHQKYDFSLMGRMPEGNITESRVKFTFDPVNGQQLINGCGGDRIPKINLPETTEYIAKDSLNRELYRLRFENGSCIIDWSQGSASDYTFDISKCIYCPPSAEGHSEELNAPEQDLAEEVKVKPNPFGSDFTVEWTLNKMSTVSIQLYSVTGELIAQPLSRAIYTRGQHQWRQPTDNLPNGVYYLKLQTDGQEQTLRVVKTE